MTTDRFAELETLRGPLTGYCYRMLGGSADAEDAVQETMLRAVTKADTFDPARARLTTWVHRIAHNVCIDMLRSARRRASPMDISELGEPGVFGEPMPAGSCVEPMPDGRLLMAADPATRVIERESIHLAFVAALQYLTPPQRSALILRDVLAFSAAETAEVLGVGTSAADSALSRARARLAEADLPEPVADDVAADLVDRYMRAFAAHDVDGLIEVLHDDATTTMPPVRWWMSGGPTIAGLIGTTDACAHDRMVMTRISGQPGVGQYRPDDSGVLRPFALVSIQVRGDRIAHLTTFLGSGGRFAEFGLPETL